jgi:hypothetical protein
VEDFVAQFHERQRSELLRQSARGLLWDRVSTYLDDFISLKWAGVGATAMAILAVGAFSLMNQGGTTSEMNMVANTPVTSMAAPKTLAVDSELIREVENGRQLAIEGILLSRHFDSDETSSADDTDIVSVSSAASPVYSELLPVNFSALNR